MAFPGASLAKAVLGVPVAAADAASTLAVRGAVLGARTTAAGVRTTVRIAEAGARSTGVLPGGTSETGDERPGVVSAVRAKAGEGARRAVRATDAFAALAAGGRRRRVWAHNGRAHIQVNGLAGTGEHHRRYVRALTEELRRLDGVNWAEVNAITGRVLVTYAEGTVDAGALVSAVQAVEDAHHADRFDEGAHAPQPDDDMAWAAATSALVADCAGVVGAVAGRLMSLPPVPSPVRAAVSVADSLPHVRSVLERRLGRLRADALLGTANAVVQGASQGVAPVAADAAHRFFQLYEIGARREAWRRREPHLVAGEQPQVCGTRAERPCPLPDGPVEKAGNRTALGHLLGGAGVLASTRDAAAAADLLLATVPKAARHGREAFAAVLAHDMAARGTVVLDPLALRRLDRVNAVVIDSQVLCNGELRLLSAVATADGMDDAGVWRAAGTVLSEYEADDLTEPGPWPADDGAWRLARAVDAPSGGPADPQGVTLDLLDARDRRCGRVRVGSSLDPLAEALLSVAHEAADVVVLTEHASVQELVAWGDDSPVSVDDLADSVRALQRDGHVVLAVSCGQDEALDAADVGVSVLRGHGLADWCADIVCGPGLAEAWRLLTAVRPARRASDRAAELSLSASALGALLIAGRRPRRRRGGPLRRAAASWQDLPPVYAASLMAMLTNGVSARRLVHRPLPAPVVRDAWHALTAEEAVRRLSRTAAEPEADREPRPAAAPLHRMLVRPGKAALRLAAAVRQELDDPLTPVLALGAAASAVVGSSVDALLVSSVMAGNALIGGAQRMRAEKALGELMLGQQIRARRLRARATAEPGGEPFAHLRTADAEQIAAGRLRVGDVVRLRSEDVVPADARLLWAESLEVDEATLTGESVPVDKNVEPSPGADPADRHCMLYEGTTVVAGSAVALVVATAEATETGRAAALAGTADASSSMQARLAELTHQALPATLLGGAAVTVLGMLRGLPLRRALGSGVAVAVAAVPEGLPLVATVSQLAAARRLSRLGVLVRSTRALEALGRVDTLCFDKTGTLTEGRLRLVRAAGPTRPHPLSGAAEQRILRTAARACPPPGGRQVAHATDRAVLDRVDALPPDDRWTLDEELPFETTRGFSASLGDDGYRTVLAVKGAPEVLLAKCTRIHTSAHRDEALTASRRRAAAATVRRLAGQGLRVLAIAERPVADPGPVRGQIAEHVEDLALLGFIGIADTPRPTAEEAVQRLGEAGVRTTMITGDHPDTAAAVAAELGIPDADRVVTGTELDAMSAADRIRAVERAAVFARVSPAQKVRIVKDLRRAGRVVAMTGDGANDAAAIRRADVGIAVVGRGSGAARTAADLVLTAPDTALILDALREGRALWHSVRDAAAILVGGNAGEVSFTVLGTALSGDAPLSTRQLLVVNMLTDMLPALAVAITPAGSGPDAAPLGGEPVRGFTGKDMRRVLAVRGTATAAAALASWQLGRLTSLVPGGRRRASTMALASLVGAQLGQTLISRWRSPLVMATCAVSAAALFAVIETPGVSAFFGCTPLGPGAWTIVTASAAAATLGAAVAPRLLPDR
ncbi:cation-translocating P-type ATPase [Actinomadura opuntiae]|uniref:cation-translocating P-type ATPase n=1 Tax=Actinomadura sp. OS1-43 TaxID=604315 RepID=UPI00255B345C|nr:cation-translocating P-type ATPase [Actinomadura sp. OS1-43]MDL4815534.1 cation-translocating P-type ATPase [Actinomadura sp. OS1-43]